MLGLELTYISKTGLRMFQVNSVDLLKPGDVYESVELIITLLGNGLVPFSANPLPKTMLTHCWLDSQGTFESKYKTLLSIKCI